jgi:hypothetical protein
MKYAAYNKAEAEKVVTAATSGNTKASYYKWSPAALDGTRVPKDGSACPCRAEFLITYLPLTSGCEFTGGKFDWRQR